MTMLSVKNWDKFQHYKDRNPPWIKLHFEIFASEDWVMLDDAGKLLAIACMLVASRNGGQIPNNPSYIARLTHIKKVDLKPLIDSGFLIDASECSQTLASACPSVSVSASVSVSETNKKVQDDFEKFWTIYPKQRCGSQGKALSAYKSALTRTTTEKIHEATVRYAASDEVARGFGKGAAAWLNDDRWTCDYQSPRTASVGKTTYFDSVKNAARAANDIIQGRENLREEEIF